MSFKFTRMSSLLEELLYGKKKEATRATEIKDASAHDESEADDVVRDEQDTSEEVVEIKKKKKIKRKL